MALQGRKPGWLLDRILGREASEDEPAATDTAPVPSPAPTPPAALPDAVPVAPVEMSAAASPVPSPPPIAPAPPPPPTPVTPPVARLPEPPPPLVAPPASEAEQIPALRGAALESMSASPPPPAPVPPEPPAAPEASPAAAPEPKRSWFRRLTEGMRRTSSALGEGVTGLFTKAKLDRATLDDLEDLLIGADLGIETAGRITDRLSSARYERGIAPSEVKAIMAGEIEAVLAPVAQPLGVDRDRKPFVLLMVGVNGAGKTTTIGKLAQKFRRQGLAVTIAAGDTFRAAAIEQLKVWGERVGAPVVARPQGSDAASLAFEALEEAKTSGADVLMIDTAGRLQNKAGLMAELEKIIRVIRKIDDSAPHATLLVLDATVGQNAVSQVELFRKTAGVTGLVMTKLDGTARGGILVALAAKFALPIHFIGVGEGVEDLEPFTARDFARAIAGLEEGG